MENIVIQRAEEKDWPYIREKLEKYALDDTDADWHQFFVVRNNGKAIAFTRIIDHVEFLEVASMGVDYYHRKKGIGKKLLRFLIEEAKTQAPNKSIYGVTHRPGFLKPFGFKEVFQAPESLKYKKHHKCILDPSKIKIMRLF